MFQTILKEQLKVPAKIEFLGELRDFVTKVGNRHSFSERVINAFKLSIDEAATNIIKHAYRDWAGNITIRAIVKKNSLTIVLVDQGKYFDPRQVSDPDLQRYVDIGKKGGLGIFIMRRLLDEIDYRKTEEGNELWMVKYRDVARKRRLTVPSLSMTLKARYWLISTSVFTLILLGVFSYNYFRHDEAIVADYLARGRTALSVLTSDVSSNLQQQLSDTALQSMIKAPTCPTISTFWRRPNRRSIPCRIRNIAISSIARSLLITTSIILASTEVSKFLKNSPCQRWPSRYKKTYCAIDFHPKQSSGYQLSCIGCPGRTLCTAHILIDFAAIRTEIGKGRWNDLNLTMVGLADRGGRPFSADLSW